MSFRRTQDVIANRARGSSHDRAFRLDGIPPAVRLADISPISLVVQPVFRSAVGGRVPEVDKAVPGIPCHASVGGYILQLEYDRIDVSERACRRPEAVRAFGDVSNGSLVVVELYDLGPWDCATSGSSMGMVVNLDGDTPLCADGHTLPVADVISDLPNNGDVLAFIERGVQPVEEIYNAVGLRCDESVNLGGGVGRVLTTQEAAFSSVDVSSKIKSRARIGSAGDIGGVNSAIDDSAVSVSLLYWACQEVFNC